MTNLSIFELKSEVTLKKLNFVIDTEFKTMIRVPSILSSIEY